MSTDQYVDMLAQELAHTRTHTRHLRGTAMRLMQVTGVVIGIVVGVLPILEARDPAEPMFIVELLDQVWLFVGGFFLWLALTCGVAALVLVSYKKQVVDQALHGVEKQPAAIESTYRTMLTINAHRNTWAARLVLGGFIWWLLGIIGIGLGFVFTLIDEPLYEVWSVPLGAGLFLGVLVIGLLLAVRSVDRILFRAGWDD